MSDSLADRITEHLGTVARLRQQRAADPALAQRVAAYAASQTEAVAETVED